MGGGLRVVVAVMVTLTVTVMVMVRVMVMVTVKVMVMVRVMVTVTVMVMVTASEVQSKMIFMGHQISSCHVPVVWSFFYPVEDVVIILNSSI